MSDGAVVVAELDELVRRLDEASRALYRLHTEFEPIAEQMDDHRNDLLTTLLSEYEDEGKRLPGEDVRNALIVKRLRDQEPLLFGQHRRLRAEIDRGERRAKQIQAEISAKQSILGFLKVEAQATA